MSWTFDLSVRSEELTRCRRRKGYRTFSWQICLFFELIFSLIWRAGATPILGKTLREYWGKWKSFMWAPHQFRELLRELLQELWCSYGSSRGMPFREWNLAFREWNVEFREAAPRIPRISPRAPRMAFSLRERFSLKFRRFPGF